MGQCEGLQTKEKHGSNGPFFSGKNGVRAVMKNKWPKYGEKTEFGGTLGLALSLWPPHSKIGGDATACNDSIFYRCRS